MNAPLLDGAAGDSAECCLSQGHRIGRFLHRTVPLSGESPSFGAATSLGLCTAMRISSLAMQSRSSRSAHERFLL